MLLLVIAFIAVFGRVLLGEVPFRRDLMALYAPAKRYLAECLAHGTLPTWYPFDGLGSPFLADPLFSTFHPTTLLFAILPFNAAFSLQVVAAPVMALGLTYRLGRLLRLSRTAATTAAIAYVLSAYFIGFTEYTYVSLAAAALPLFASGLVQARRRGAVDELALGAGLLLLAGDGHLLLMACLMMPLLGLRFSRRGSRRAPMLLVGLGIGAMLGAIQELPTLALLPETHRALGGAAEATKWALTLPGILNLAWSRLHGLPTDLLPSTYAGLSVVLLGLLGAQWGGRARWRWWTGALLFLLLAMGPATPLWGAASAVLPLWSRMRFPIKALGPACFLWALLAGVGAHQVERRLRAFGAQHSAWLVPLVVIADLVFANAQLFATHRPPDSSPGPLAIALRARGVGVGAYAYDEAIDGSQLRPSVQTGFGATADPERWSAYERRALTSSCGQEWGLPSSAVSLPLALERRWEWEHRFGQEWIDGRCGLFASRFVILADAQVAQAGVGSRVVGGDDELGLSAVDYPDALPFAYLASQPRFCMRTECAALAAAPSFRPGSEVAVEGPGTTAEPPLAPPIAASTVRIQSGTTSVRIQSDHRGYLVMNQPFVEGLAASVDGHPASVEVANGLVRTVQLESGEHQVVVTYHPPGLMPGAMLSALGVLALMVLWSQARRRIRASP